MLYISNRGLVEAGALTLLGASVKEGEAIGKFGSGFKYGIATLIREGYAIRVWSGLREIKIETRPEKFRDREFQVIYVDGERTSITTNTGVEWKVRDAVREIWSNALDEGEAGRSINDPQLAEDRTTIGIELKGEVADMVADWTSYFVHEVKEIESNLYGRILDQPIPNYFRRGIWICEDREKPALFSYDFRNIDLPESRKIKSHSTAYQVYEVLTDCSSIQVFDRLFDSIKDESMERYAIAYWSLHGKGKQTILESFNKRWDFVGNIRNHAKISGQTLGKRVLWLADDALSMCLQLNLPRIEDNLEWDERYTIKPWPIGYKDRVMPIIDTLKKVGVDLTKFNVVYAHFESSKFNEVPIALADMKSKACLLSDRAFESSPDMLMKALVEEWTHLEHEVLDHTVAQQHVYLTLIVNLIKENKNV